METMSEARAMHDCERIDLENGVVTVPDSIVHVSECGHGCCDTYRCTVCGRVFTVEWPD